MNTNMDMLWPLITIVAVGVFFIRFSFFWAMERITVTPTIRRVLTYIPAAVLPAIIIPSVVFKGATPGLYVGNMRLWATAVAIAVAWKTENLFVTIGAGLGALWFMQWISL